MFEGIMQPMHLVVILVIALLFFGPSKLAGLQAIDFSGTLPLFIPQ